MLENNAIVIYNADSHQDSHRMCSAGNKGAIIDWTNRRNLATNTDVYGQRIGYTDVSTDSSNDDNDDKNADNGESVISSFYLVPFLVGIDCISIYISRKSYNNFKN